MKIPRDVYLAFGLDPDDPQRKAYTANCRVCAAPLDSRRDATCPVCSWLECGSCGACGCF